MSNFETVLALCLAAVSAVGIYCLLHYNHRANAWWERERKSEAFREVEMRLRRVASILVARERKRIGDDLAAGKALPVIVLDLLDDAKSYLGPAGLAVLLEALGSDAAVDHHVSAALVDHAGLLGEVPHVA